MYPIFYRTLNSQLMKAMKAGEVSIDEVKEIRDSLTAKKYKILEWIYLVIAAVLVVFVIGLVATGHYPESFSTGECALVIFHRCLCCDCSLFCLVRANQKAVQFRLEKRISGQVRRT